MKDELARKYPLAQKAFDEQDAFYAAIGEKLPGDVSYARERVAVILDQCLDWPRDRTETLIISAAVALDPLASHKIYDYPEDYPGVDAIMTTLISAIKTRPNDPLPADVAPMLTAIAVAKMEQTTDKVRAGKLKVTPEAVKGSLKRGAINDALYLPNLQSKELKDLYETTQFAYFSALETAANSKKPPAPPDPGGPVF